MLLEFKNIDVKNEIAFYEEKFNEMKTEMIELSKKIEIIKQTRDEFLDLK